MTDPLVCVDISYAVLPSDLRRYSAENVRAVTALCLRDIVEARDTDSTLARLAEQFRDDPGTFDEIIDSCTERRPTSLTSRRPLGAYGYIVWFVSGDFAVVPVP